MRSKEKLSPRLYASVGTLSFILFACKKKKSITSFWGFVIAICKYFKEKTCWVLQPALNGAVKFLSDNFSEGRRV